MKFDEPYMSVMCGLISQCINHCVYSTRLVAGDVEGMFERLFTRVGNIQKKSGQFDVRTYM